MADAADSAHVVESGGAGAAAAADSSEVDRFCDAIFSRWNLDQYIDRGQGAQLLAAVQAHSVNYVRRYIAAREEVNAWAAAEKERLKAELEARPLGLFGDLPIELVVRIFEMVGTAQFVTTPDNLADLSATQHYSVEHGFTTPLTGLAALPYVCKHFRTVCREHVIAPKLQLYRGDAWVMRQGFKPLAGDGVANVIRRFKAAREFELTNIDVRTTALSDALAQRTRGEHLSRLHLRNCPGVTDELLLQLHGTCPGLVDITIEHTKEAEHLALIQGDDQGSDNGSDDEVDISYVDGWSPDDFRLVTSRGIIACLEGVGGTLVNLNLDLMECVDDAMATTIGHWCKHLEKLNMSYTDITDHGIGDIVRGCARLTHLQLKRAHSISDATLALVAEHSRSIKFLDVASTNITGDTLPDEFRFEPNGELHMLNLQSVEVTDVGLDRIAKMFLRVGWVDLSWTRTVDVGTVESGLRRWGGHLRRLALEHCRGGIDDTIGLVVGRYCPNIEVIDLIDNPDDISDGLYTNMLDDSLGQAAWSRLRAVRATAWWEEDSREEPRFIKAHPNVRLGEDAF